jgi:hypothetical protein
MSIRPREDGLISVALIRSQDTEKDNESQVGQYELDKEPHAARSQPVDKASGKGLDKR